MKFFLPLLTFISLSPCFAQEVDVLKLLQLSDRARGGLAQGVSWDVQITSQEDGNDSDRSFSVKAKGDNAYVEATSPARNKGEIYLFNDRAMWFFKPALKKPVSISSREKMVGQAANGDIASTHYARDYTPTLEKEEVLNGEKMYVLLLKAKSKQVTYDQIRYWISDKHKLAMKAEFLTLQGKAFKEADFDYKNAIMADGKKALFVSRMTIVDSKFKNRKSVMIYKNPKAESQADSLFNVNNLSR